MRDDLIKRLAAANPVPGSYGLRPAFKARRGVRMAVVALIAAVIAAAIGFSFLALSKSDPTGPNPAAIGPLILNGPTGAIGPTGVFLGPTGWTGPREAGRVWTPIALTDASAALGAPVFLPKAPAVPPSESAQASATAQCPHRGENPTSKCNVAIHLPSLTVLYSRVTQADPLAVYQDAAKSHTNRAEVDYIGGIPALVISNPEDHAHPSNNWSFVGFVVGGTTVALTGQDAATLTAAAKSIIDQANAS